MGEPRPIGELVEKNLGSRRLRDAVHLGRLRLVWEEVVGASLARRTRLVELKGATAVVQAADGQAREILVEMLGELEARLRERSAGELRGVELRL